MGAEVPSPQYIIHEKRVNVTDAVQAFVRCMCGLSVWFINHSGVNTFPCKTGTRN